MPGSPAFRKTRRTTQATASVANPNVDGTGTMVELMAGVASVPAGTDVTIIGATARGNTTPGWLRLFISLDGGTTKKLVAGSERYVERNTTDASRGRWFTYWRDVFGLKDANAKLYLATEIGETFDITTEGWDLAA